MAEQRGAAATAGKAGEPYCGNCGYVLSGLVESSKCPECGKPLVEVLNRFGRWGRRYQSRTRLFGLPIVSWAYGPVPGERMGHAKGVFAFGDRATGIVAVGGMACGVVAFGGLAIGLITFGGLSLGLLAAMGGVAIGALSYGGVSIGGASTGGVVAGVIAVGGLAIGNWAAGGMPIGQFVAGPGGNDQEALNMLASMQWFFGSGSMGIVQPMLVILGLAAAVSGFVGLLAALAHMRQSRGAESP